MTQLPSDEQLLAVLLETAPTKTELARQIRLLRNFLEYRFFTSIETTPTLLEYCAAREIPTEDGDIMKMWRSDFINAFDKHNAYKRINTMTEDIKNLPYISLYAPVALDTASLIKIGAWFRQTTGANMLLDIHIDPERVGGCAIAQNGVYRDYSLHYILEKHKDAVKNVLDTYAGQIT